MRKQRWLTALLGALCALGPPCAPAIRAEEKPAVVLVVSEGSEPYAAARDGFREAWAEAGPLTVHVLDEKQKAPSVLAALRADPPSALVTLGTWATREVGAALPEVPLVAGLVVDPEVVGDHPRATVLVTDFPLATQVEWMRRLLPDRRAIGVVYSPEANGARIREAERAFADAGLELLAEPVRSPTELPLALRNLKQRADLIWGLADPVVVSPETAKALLLFSFQNRIPLAGLSSSWVRAGALYALERDYRDLGRQCAELARGARQRREGRVARETPRAVRYELNLRAAEHMHVKFDGDVRRKASQVFE